MITPLLLLIIITIILYYLYLQQQTWSKPRINMSHLLVWQRVNHFLDSKQLTRKDLLKKNLQRYTTTTTTTTATIASGTGGGEGRGLSEGNSNDTSSHPHQNNNNNNKSSHSYFEIMPLTFLLPREYVQFVKSFTDAASTTNNNNNNSADGTSKNFWILKPVSN